MTVCISGKLAPLVRQRLPSDRIQPGQRLRRDLVDPSQANQERLRDHIVHKSVRCPASHVCPNGLPVIRIDLLEPLPHLTPSMSGTRQTLRRVGSRSLRRYSGTLAQSSVGHSVPLLEGAAAEGEVHVRCLPGRAVGVPAPVGVLAEDVVSRSPGRIASTDLSDSQVRVVESLLRGAVAE